MLDATAKELAQGKNFAALTTLSPSGQPSTQVMWVDADDDHILVNTEIGRQKFHNVQHDPRTAITIIDAANPYRYSEVRGRVVGTVTGAEARQHIDRLSEKYTGGPYADPIATARETLQIELLRVRPQG